MTNVLHHRGPDGCGYYRDAHAGLGHRRLSIIDVAAGQQPMANESESLWITYNGEIFNHASLRPDLERRGHRYRTRCDTETIVHAWEEHGADSLSLFRGMFAFALWDRQTRTLFCARDRLGIKPLYYFWDGSVFVFASEIKALLEHPAVSAELDCAGLPEYLALGYRSGESTLFRNIRKLMPGHHLSISLEAARPEPRIVRYWDLPSPRLEQERDPREWIAECRERVEESVRMRLMSDVPLGVFLSGGIDSSAIAALMRGMVDGPVKTFAVGYREKSFSELDYAARVAHALGTEHRQVVISREDFFSVLPRLIWHEDEPIAWPSSVSLYFVAQLAAREVKVVLTGEGSDEIFGGYSRYHFFALNQRWLGAYRLLPAPLRRGIRDFVAGSRLLSAGVRRKLQHTFLGRGESLESLYLDNFYAAFSGPGLEALLPDSVRLPSPFAPYLEYWNARPEASALARLLYADQKTYLVELLMKQDQMSMAASLESRVPFLDHTLVEFASRVPDSLKIHRGSGKFILKQAVAGLLPPDIINRPKMGFPTPMRQWLSDPGGPICSALTSRASWMADYLDMSQVDALLGRHQAGIEDATDRIWRLVNLEWWGQAFLQGAASREKLLASSSTLMPS